jgi:hypothetical protein
MTTTQTPPTRTGHGVGIAALILSIAAPVITLVGFFWAMATRDMGALTILVFTLLAVGIVALAAVIVSLISLAVSRPNRHAKIALLIVGLTAIGVFLAIFPPPRWFA